MESQWLRDAIWFSMKGSIATSVADDEPGPPQQRDPRFRKLAEGLIYSRKFIVTYHLLVLLVILGFTAVHWSGKAIRMWRRQATRLQILARDDAFDRDAGIIKPILQDEGTSSSGSSTLEGTASPPSKDASEETPLLHQGHTLRPRGSLYPRRTLLSRIKAFLMYQPRPIPVFKKTLPSNETTIVLLSFIGLNIFYCLYNINFNLFELFVLADRFGLVFVANLPLLYLFAAKTQPLKLLTGRSYEGLNIFHRRLGELLCLEALFHTVGMFFVWYTLLRPAGFSFFQFIFNRIIVLGLLTILAYEMIYFTSLGSFRQRWYELFLASHVFLQVVALVFVFFHHSGTQIYVGFALAIFSVDRLVYRIGLNSLTAEADTKIFEDGQTVCLSTNIVKQPCRALSQIFGRSILGGWQATDHVFLTVPSLSRKHIIQAHPFTIASGAPRPEDEEGRLDLLIRAKAGFSADLLRKVRHHGRLTIRLDGPYGSSHARDMLEDSELSIVVAGCSGIAVAWPLIQHLLDVTRSTDTEIAPTSLLRRQKIVLVWVVRKASQLSWIPGQAIANTADMGVEIIISRPTEDVGRPNLEFIIDGLVDEFGEGKKVGVVASGPDSMARCVRNTCAKLVGMVGMSMLPSRSSGGRLLYTTAFLASVEISTYRQVYKSQGFSALEAMIMDVDGTSRRIDDLMIPY